MTGGLLVRSAVTMTCDEMRTGFQTDIIRTHRNRLHFADLLDLVTSRSDLQALEDGLNLGPREQPLLGSLGGIMLGRALEDDFILLILVEQGLLVVDGT